MIKSRMKTPKIFVIISLENIHILGCDIKQKLQNIFRIQMSIIKLPLRSQFQKIISVISSEN